MQQSRVKKKKSALRAVSAVICTLTVMLTALILCFYILVVCGASEKLQNIWVCSAMLDGGSSTAMVYNETYINKPCLGHERWINNAFVVMPSAE